MKLLFIFLLLSFSFSKDVYFLPFDSKKAENRLYYLFTHAKKNIKIIIYSFTNKKLAKALKIASTHNVKITIIADKKEAMYQKSVISNLATIKNINILLLSGKNYKNSTNKGKLHAKISIIDNKILITGSANYTYSAFYKNYEYILIHKDKKLLRKFNNFFKKLYQLSTPYRLSIKETIIY